MGLGKRQEPDDAKDNTKDLGLASWMTASKNWNDYISVLELNI